jgi:hypothetical protein
MSQESQSTQPHNEATPTSPQNRVEGASAVASVTMPAEPTKSNVDWPGVLAPWAWPLTILIILLIFRTRVGRLLDGLGAFLGDLEEGRVGPVWGKRNRSGKVPPPPSTGPPPTGAVENALSGEAHELLATLWNHHLKHFGQDFTTRRWTFLVSPASPRYPAFLKALSETVNAGLVAVSPQNLQCFLTNQGVEYCKKNLEQLQGDYWEA